jgi:hypothetical protein
MVGTERAVPAQAKHDGVIGALLALLGRMLDVAAGAALPPPQEEAAQQLASSIIARRMKARHLA